MTLTDYRLLLLIGLAGASYIPPYYEGTPTDINVVRLDPPDYRGQETFRIEFALATSEGLTQVLALATNHQAKF